MAENSKIEWTDHTFNPWVGCSKVAPGCANCYAEADFDKRRHVAQWGAHGTRIKTSPANWAKPLKWNRDARCTCNAPLGQSSMESFSTCPQHRHSGRPRVFCASLSDVFEDWSGPVLNHTGERLVRCDGRDLTLDDVRRDLFSLVGATPNLDWLLLTKRPENVLSMWIPPSFGGRGNAMNHAATADVLRREHPHLASEWMRRNNVWLGTSISDQATADKSIPELLKCRDLCPVLFVSAEPLLGPIKLPFRYGDDPYHGDYGQSLIQQSLDWVIVGGESGHNARPCDVSWVRSLVKQCQGADVPVLVKQFGANVVTRNDQIEDEFNDGESGWPEPEVEHDIHGFREDYQGADCRIRLRDRKGGDWTEWPADLRVRQFPRIASGVAR